MTFRTFCDILNSKRYYKKGEFFMTNKSSTNYFDEILQTSKPSRKQVALYLDDTKVEQIDMVAKQFSSISDAKSFSRNTLIETAIDKFLIESKDYLLNTYNIDVDQLIDKSHLEKFDTVIFSAHDDQIFRDAFFGEGGTLWWPDCNINSDRAKHIKYIAIYRGVPTSAITHYAKVKMDGFKTENGKKNFYLECSPIELPHKITIGSKPSCFFNGAKYTTLESLLNATKADELTFG